MELTRLIVTKPDGTVVGDIDPTLIVDAGFVQEVNGEHSVSLSTYEELSKNDRILWRDEMGHWHENVVEGTEGEHGEHGDTLHEYWCPWSLQHDLVATFVTAMPGTGGTPAPALAALQAALGGTERWQVGTVTQASSGSASMWRVSGWEALQTLVEVWGGELSATIDVDGSGVIGRFVNLLAHVGASTPTRRFDYGGDLMGIRRKVADQPWTCRVVPLGKAQQTEGGGYGRKVTIEDVNGGVIWLENAATTPLVRVPTEDGWEYPTQIVENPEIDDPAALKAWALENLDEWTWPKASYEVDVLQLAQAGTDATGVAEGDEVVIVDHGFTADGLAIQGRALRIDGSLLDPTQTTLTISNLSETLGGQLGAIARSVSQLASQQQATSLYQATADYLSQLLARLNGEANATGGYTYITEGEGIRTYDVAVSDPLVGAEASKVVEVKGGTIRIANSRTQAGEWDWRTVFVSGHVLADLVTAAKLTSGYIGSADSGNYWDLDSGEFRMASTAMLGDKTVQQVLDGVDDTITGVDVEFAQGTSPTQAPTSGWQTQPPAWEAGKYIWMRTATTTADGTSYSTPAMISGKDGADGTSVTIKGSYNTLAELQAAHPTGSSGDAYMVGTDLYVWNGSAWEDVGQIQGPQGPAGTSVTVSSIQYGTSTSASTAPTSWTTTPPTSIAAGRWLWVRTNYSNGSTATTKSYVGTNGMSVYVQSTSKVDGVTTIVLASSDGTTSTIRIADGEDGATGQRGPAGENGESNYIHTAWANSADGTTDFSTTVSAGKSYLGVCTDQNTADPTTPSSYSWSKIEGAAGADGKGVRSVTEQYYLSTSSSTQSGGAWATSPAAYVTGRFYWTRTITTYTDNTAVISEPVLARGLNSANKTAADAQATADSNTARLDDENLLLNSSPMSAWKQHNENAYLCGVIDCASALTAGQQYTLQVWGSVSRSDQTAVLTAFYGDSSHQIGNMTESNGVWTLTFTMPSWTGLTPQIRLYVGPTPYVSTATYTADLTAAKLTKGTYKGGWIPNVADYTTQIGIFNQLTNNGETQGLYMQDEKVYINASYIQSGAISADYISGGTLEGTNVRVTSGNIRTILSNDGTLKFYYFVQNTWRFVGQLAGNINSGGLNLDAGYGFTESASKITVNRIASGTSGTVYNTGTAVTTSFSTPIVTNVTVSGGSTSVTTKTLHIDVVNGRITRLSLT